MPDSVGNTEFVLETVRKNTPLRNSVTFAFLRTGKIRSSMLAVTDHLPPDRLRSTVLDSIQTDCSLQSCFFMVNIYLADEISCQCGTWRSVTLLPAVSHWSLIFLSPVPKLIPHFSKIIFNVILSSISLSLSSQNYVYISYIYMCYIFNLLFHWIILWMLRWQRELSKS